MSNTTAETPKGTKDFLPGDTGRKRWIENTLLALFDRWNYREIVTPTMEYHDVISAGGATGLGERLYRLFEREGGLIALRPDMTTPVARMVATRLQAEPKPIRLAYNANVFRYAQPHAGRRREFYQVGVELVGSSEHAADVEIIALAVQALQAVGLENFRVDVGHVNYYDGILQHGALSPRERRDIRTALLKKDYVALEQCVSESGLTAPEGELLRMLPDLRGGQGMLGEAWERATNPTSRGAVSDLSDIYAALEAYGLARWVQIDLGMVKDIEYYTGMVLEAYTADMGFTIGTGGRYDNLIGQFGYNCPATGFALGVERIMLALPRQSEWPDSARAAILCAWTDGDAGCAWEIAQMLRRGGGRVELDLSPRAQIEIPAYAEKRGLNWAILPLADHRVQLWSAGDGWRTMDLAGLPAHLGGGGDCG